MLRIRANVSLPYFVEDVVVSKRDVIECLFFGRWAY